MFERAAARAGALLVLVSLAGCQENVSGPCVNIYRDPVLAVDALQSTTGENIPSADLSDFRIDGSAVDASRLADIDSAYGVQVASADTLRCDVPCGFGRQEGRYAFRVDAEGYRPKSVEVEATFEEFAGGCPSSNSGSTVIELSLTPSG